MIFFYTLTGFVAGFWLSAVLDLGEFWSHRWTALGCRLPQLHHFYYGLTLAWWPGAPLWVRFIGLYCMSDDARQHTLQAVGEHDYRSPLHRLGAWAFYRPLAWLRACLT